MPIAKGDKGRNMGSTNSSLRREITEDIINEITDIGNIQRARNSIYTSENFHLDAKGLGKDRYQAEIQYRRGTKQTVAVIEVSDTATSAADARAALTKSLNDGYRWIVT
ncbi:hypothetical protein [Aneurinibacillus sp. REN35]|uniref:hypothetical protein n=1 Tax=Aneurinibacillus sp. REN35 TaxID=3237286 RepID=UPI0035294D22